MKFFLQLAASLYAALVGFSAIWAWYAFVAYLHSPHEHLLPSTLLFFVSAPTSLVLEPLSVHWPALSSSPSSVLALLCLCGAFQVTIAFLLVAWLNKPPREA
jgi:hypothetical protein